MDTQTMHRYSSARATQPHRSFMSFAWIWEQTAIISLQSSDLFFKPIYSVYCAVRSGDLKIILSQFTAESVVRPPSEFCGAESSTGKDICPSSLLRVFSCQYHSAQARYLSSSTQQNLGNFRKQRNFGNRTAMYRKKKHFHSVFKCFILSIKRGRKKNRFYYYSNKPTKN